MNWARSGQPLTFPHTHIKGKVYCNYEFWAQKSLTKKATTKPSHFSIRWKHWLIKIWNSAYCQQYTLHTWIILQENRYSVCKAFYFFSISLSKFIVFTILFKRDYSLPKCHRYTWKAMWYCFNCCFLRNTHFLIK